MIVIKNFPCKASEKKNNSALNIQYTYRQVTIAKGNFINEIVSLAINSIRNSANILPSSYMMNCSFYTNIIAVL